MRFLWHQASSCCAEKLRMGTNTDLGAGHLGAWLSITSASLCGPWHLPETHLQGQGLQLNRLSNINGQSTEWNKY